MSDPNGWGGQPPPAWYGYPEHPPVPPRRRRTGIVVAVLLTVSILIGGGVVAAVAISGGDDENDQSRTSETTSSDVDEVEDGDAGPSGSDLIAELKATDYSCYDSLPDPVVRRCFAVTAMGRGGDPSYVTTTVSVQTDDADQIEALYVGAETEYSDPAAEIAATRKAWRLVGATVLGPEADRLANRIGGNHQAPLAWGTMSFSGYPIGVMVRATGQPPATAVSGLDLPLVDVQAALREAGLRCDAVNLCDRGDGYTASVFPVGDDVGALQLGTYNPDLYADGAGRPARVRAELIELVDAVGLGGAELSRLLSAGFAAPDGAPVVADFGGRHYAFAVRWVGPGQVFKTTLDIEPIRLA